MELASKTFMRSTATALAALLLTTFAHSDVWIVDATGGGDFRDLQPAVDAAGDGDTLVVRDGVYSTFFAIDKGLSVVAERGATPEVLGTVVVRDLSAGKEFVLSGLRVTASPSSDLNLVNGLILFNDFGPVRIQDCLLTGTYGSIGPAGRGALLHGKPGTRRNTAASAASGCGSGTSRVCTQTRRRGSPSSARSTRRPGRESRL